MKNKKNKKSNKKKQEIEIIENEETTNRYIQDNNSLIYTKILAVVFLILAIVSITIGTICVIQINEAVQYIPDDVYYPNILLSFFAIVNTVSFVVVFITLFLMVLFDDGTGIDLDDNYHHSYYD